MSKFEDERDGAAARKVALIFEPMFYDAADNEKLHEYIRIRSGGFENGFKAGADWARRYLAIETQVRRTYPEGG